MNIFKNYSKKSNNDICLTYASFVVVIRFIANSDNQLSTLNVVQAKFLQQTIQPGCSVNAEKC
jgi:hypothetical protein